jgi:hypothetical protein
VRPNPAGAIVGFAGGINTALQGEPGVYLATVANGGNGDDASLVINGIDDPIVA